MLLLRLKTHELVRFDNVRTIPDYAILSHTWGEGEISFDELNAYNAQEISTECIHAKQGFQKVLNFCQTALTFGFEYGWIDTCCIDKRSSAELDEAIRSMYQWYENAKLCIVFLADVQPNASRKEFCQSKWFTRGWTLQELIAPPKVSFFDCAWHKYGPLVHRDILDDVCKTTNIDRAILTCESERRNMISSRSIARRMSWASNRETTRKEDEAYCLMGIFNIQMPVMYGEGRHAFYRLQKAIIESSIDQTIFVWKEDVADSSLMRGLLAESPSEFRHTGQFTPDRTRVLPKARRIDARGLYFDEEAVKIPAAYNIGRELSMSSLPEKAYFLRLLCHDEQGKECGPAIVFLENGLAVRVLSDSLFACPSTPSSKHLSYAVPIGRYVRLILWSNKNHHANVAGGRVSRDSKLTYYSMARIYDVPGFFRLSL